MPEKIRYVLMDSAKNMTLLVETPVPPDSQPAVAAELMKQEPAAEQVGFLSDAGGTVFLRMAGGEFCGNAAMSAAVYHAMRSGMTEGHVSVHVSGTPEPVSVSVSCISGPADEPDNVSGQDSTGGLWQGIVDMPLPLSAERKTLYAERSIIPEKQAVLPEKYLLPVVTFRGITHILLNGGLTERSVLPNGKFPAGSMEKETAEALAKAWCAGLHADALGLMFLNEKEKQLTPLVYVPAADTLFWESSCASGTTAAGAWLAKKAGRPVVLSLSQPGGILEISAGPDGPLLLKGTVRCEYRKTVTLD